MKESENLINQAAKEAYQEGDLRMAALLNLLLAAKYFGAIDGLAKVMDTHMAMVVSEIKAKQN